jgi:hypothetical protein
MLRGFLFTCRGLQNAPRVIFFGVRRALAALLSIDLSMAAFIGAKSPQRKAVTSRRTPKKRPQRVGLIHGPSEHHLDHLAPLCALQNIPLVVTDEFVFEQAHHYYPAVDTRYLHYHEMPFAVAGEFDAVITALPKEAFEELFFFPQKMLNKKLESIWCPHGNSDKGHASDFMEALRQETQALVYGKKMVDFLQQKEAFNQLKKVEHLGNYRKKFADLHREFYSQVIEKEIESHLNPEGRTLLFAPTWEDAERSSTFFLALPFLLEQLPEHFNLIVKPHPNLKREKSVEIEELLSRYPQKKNVLFLWHFPPIYPLLEKVDYYLGDMSSIGYDFLSFNRPMFFLNPNQRNPQKDEGLYLFRCGTEIPPEEFSRIYEFIEERSAKDKQFSALRNEVYRYTFEL